MSIRRPQNIQLALERFDLFQYKTIPLEVDYFVFLIMSNRFRNYFIHKPVKGTMIVFSLIEFVDILSENDSIYF